MLHRKKPGTNRPSSEFLLLASLPLPFIWLPFIWLPFIWLPFICKLITQEKISFPDCPSCPYLLLLVPVVSKLTLGAALVEADRFLHKSPLSSQTIITENQAVLSNRRRRRLSPSWIDCRTILLPDIDTGEISIPFPFRWWGQAKTMGRPDGDSGRRPCSRWATSRQSEACEPGR